jgi:hypothetical protein
MNHQRFSTINSFEVYHPFFNKQGDLPLPPKNRFLLFYATQTKRVALKRFSFRR